MGTAQSKHTNWRPSQLSSRGKVRRRDRAGGLGWTTQRSEQFISMCQKHHKDGPTIGSIQSGNTYSASPQAARLD